MNQKKKVSSDLILNEEKTKKDKDKKEKGEEVNSPLIIFCTTCKGRLEYLKQTLPQNIIDNNDYPNCKFVILDYGNSSELQEYFKESYQDLIDSGKLSIYTYITDKNFHMAHAKNMAARCGILEGADIIVTLDADNFTCSSFAKYIAEIFKEIGIFLCPNFPVINSMPHGPDRPARGYAGRLAIRARDFIKLGGYDEIYDTWRGEDIDLIYRLQRVGYKIRHIPNKFLSAIRHSSEVRFKEYPHAKEYEYEGYIKIIASRIETLVNYGKFGLGITYKNFNFSSLKANLLPSIPTRIFGIGMHKTATTSLHKAFQILGLDSFHFRTGYEARAIWDEMNSAGRSETLERFYALSDLPIPLLYKKLDQVYPNSKFILTIRDEESWLKSVKKLWSDNHNPYRWTWDVYPFSHRIHTALYGQREFDEQVFLERYRAHNFEVIEYFKDRPNDLLIMNMSNNAGWNELCEFLDKSIPTVAYPREFVSK